jgi:hypothetical protein
MRTCTHQNRVATLEHVTPPTPAAFGSAVLVERCVHCSYAREVRVRFEYEGERPTILVRGVETDPKPC